MDSQNNSKQVLLEVCEADMYHFCPQTCTISARRHVPFLPQISRFVLAGKVQVAATRWADLSRKECDERTLGRRPAYIYIYIYIYMYIYIYIYIYTYTFTYICMPTHVYLTQYIYMYIYISIHIYLYIHIYTYTYTYICMPTHVYLTLTTS